VTSGSVADAELEIDWNCCDFRRFVVLKFKICGFKISELLVFRISRLSSGKISESQDF